MSARSWCVSIIAATCALLPARLFAQDVVEYYAVDAIGSVRVVFDAAGTVTSRMDYGPFGEQLAPSTLGAKSYAQLFRDGEAGQDYAEARSYQSRTGRFGAPDPAYTGLLQPQAWNRYSYALNNPLSFVDPTGLMADACVWTEQWVEGKDKDGKDGYLQSVLKCPDNNGSGGGGSGPVSLELMWFLLSGGRAPNRSSGNDNVGDSGTASFVATLLGSFVPFVGETLDAKVILNSESIGDQLLAAGSLTINVATGGLAPNFGASAVQGARLGRRLAAQEIAGGHAFGKHVLERGEFPGIRTRAEFAGMIESVMENASDIRQLSAGRTAFWKDGVVVIRNPYAVDGGTAFVPTTGFKYFVGLK